MIKKIMNIRSKKIWYITLVVLFGSCIFLFYRAGITDFVHDSSYYWNIADSTLSDDIFKLSNYPETYRGCLFPLVILLFKTIFKGFWGWRLLSGIMVASCFGIFFPIIFNFKINTFKNLAKTILAESIFLYMWGNYIQYPLSDFAAFWFFVAGISVAKYAIEGMNLNDKGGISLKSLFIFILCGVFLYASYNTRVVYFFAIIIVYIYVFVSLRRTRKNLIVALAFTFCGMAICSIPQCIVNNQYVAFSPKVYTEQSAGYEKSLQAKQVLWGLTIQRYETFIGNTDDYSLPAIIFNDASGTKISALEGLNVENFTFKDLLRIGAKYPLDFIGVYTRHLITLATPAWNEVYIGRLYTDKSLLVMLSIAIWYVGGLSLLEKIDNQRMSCRSSLIVIAMFIPGLLQLFGAPELRFFISLYVFMYAYVFMKVEYRDLFKYIKPRWRQILVIFLVILALWLTVFGDTLASNDSRIFLIHDSY